MEITNLDVTKTLLLKEAVLKRMPVAFRKYYSTSFLQKVDLNIIADDFSDRIYLELRGFLYGTKKVVENEVKVPKGLLDYVKVRYFPKWLAIKFPPKYTIISQQIVNYNSFP